MESWVNWVKEREATYQDNRVIIETVVELADIRIPPIVTSDFVYVRLIGDRTIQEKDFGQIQIDRVKEMRKVARTFKDETNEGNLSNIRFAIIAANNHCAGFGPGTVNIFRQLLGIEEVGWGDAYVSKDDLGESYDKRTNNRAIRTKQTSMSDFFQ